MRKEASAGGRVPFVYMGRRGNVAVCTACRGEGLPYSIAWGGEEYGR